MLISRSPDESGAFLRETTKAFEVRVESSLRLDLSSIR